MNKGEEEEESRRRFLFNALQLVCDDNKGQKPSGPSTTKLSTGSANANKHKPNDFREHGQGNWNYTKVTRIPQLDTWDCGIACLLMITLWLRDDREYDIQFDNNGKEIHHHGEDLDALSEADAEHCFRARMAPERKKCLSHVGTESIWTSDLMRQLQSWKTRRKGMIESKIEPWLLSLSSLVAAAGIPSIESGDDFVFVLASKQIMGVDESYKDFHYYQRAFEEDQSRVARTFRDLHRQNVPMLQTTSRVGHCGRGLSLSTVINIVERDDCLAIVLLDNRVLLATTKNFISTPAPKDNHHGGFETSRPPYAGHYVIICGTSDDPKHVEIANSGEKNDHSGPMREEKGETTKAFCFVLCNPDPSSTVPGSNYTFVTPERLEASWRAEGTDEDVIFLRKPKCQAPTKILQNKRSLLPQRSSAYEIDKTNTDDRNVQRNSQAHCFSARIQNLVRENYGALTYSLWTFYKHNFPPFCRH